MYFSTVNYRRKSILALTLATSLISACQLTPKAPTIDQQLPAQVRPDQAFKYFSITGKIGVRTPEQNGSAFYGWTQRGEWFAIDLSGALGIGQTSIEGEPGKITLENSKVGSLTAATASELLTEATGWNAPIEHLLYWINAKTATKTAKTSKDQNNRLQSIDEDGWQVTLAYKDNDALPNHLTMIHPLANGQQNKVILTIQTRQ